MTALGPAVSWPPALRSAVQVMTSSPRPTWLAWGPERLFLYNDACLPYLGERHPSARGCPLADAWPEGWQVVRPFVQVWPGGGEHRQLEAQRLEVVRDDQVQEAHISFSFSPLGSEGGGVAGVLGSMTDETARVVAERQLATLREVAARTADARGWREACERAVGAMAGNQHDFRFALVYRAGEGGRPLLAGSSVRASAMANPALWPCEEVLRDGQLRVVGFEPSGPGAPGTSLAWPTTRAALVPLAAADGAGGVLLVGLNPLRPFDDGYRSFLELVAGQLTAAIASAESRPPAGGSPWAARRTEARTADPLDELETVLRAVPIGVFIARDAAATQISMNPAGAALLRIPEDANASKTGPASGQLPFRVYRDGQEVAGPDLPIQRAARSGRPVIGDELEVVFHDGTSVTLHEHAVPLFDEAGKVRGCVGVFADVTERKRGERMLVEQKQLLELIAVGRPLDECLASVAASIGRLSPGVRACVLLTDAEQRLFVRAIGPQLPPGFLEGLEAPGDGLGQGAWADALFSGMPVTSPDVRGDSRWSASWRELYLANGIRGCHAYPIIGTGGSVVGSFLLCYERPRAPSDLESRLAQFGAHLASIAHDRAQREAALLEADRRKDEFLATLSHELRNPLGPLQNALELLKRLRPDQDQRPVRDLMERQVRQLVRLVDDLMEVSRITRGSLDLQVERTALQTVLRTALETSEPALKALDHQLKLSLPSEDLPVDADPVRLGQVFANLLNNAARYTGRGGTITVEARRQGGEAVVTVTDTGEGIDADQLPALFRMFSRGRRSARMDQAGLGVGLALSRRLVGLHGGSIEAASGGQGQGSQFTVRLRLAEGAAPQPAAVVGPGTHFQGVRVLLVDDNVDATESLGRLLADMGADVEVANDGPAALSAFERQRPSVVLLDIGMPGMDGYEVARRIRERERATEGKRVVIAALTGWGQEQDRQRTRNAGFDHHLTKPAGLGALQDLLAPRA